MLIYLVGYMGAGKSTVGKKLASTLNFKFLDLDNVIEKTAGCSIADYFKTHDEKTFRDFEQQCLLKATKRKDTVISTGGGTPCFKDNMDVMNEHGITIYIQLSIGSLFHRLAQSKKERPLIKDMKDIDLIEFIIEHFTFRERYYLQAHHVVKGENIKVDSIVKLIEKSKKKNNQLR